MTPQPGDTPAGRNAWSQAVGAGPYLGSSVTFVIAEGSIHEVTDRFDFSEFSPEVFDVFDTRLIDAHLDDVAIMWNPDTGNAHLTPEAIALFASAQEES